MSESKPVFIASDVHLGATPGEQERAFTAWLEHAAASASWIILNGDLFDYWVEHRDGVPSGYEATLSQLKRITGSGVPVTLMGGNHDWWGGAYLREEVGLEFLQEPVVREIAGRTALLAHGDGLGAGDLGYRVLKFVLHSRPFVFGYKLLPVRLGERIARRVSHTEDRWETWSASREARADALEVYARDFLESRPELDLVLLGHTHLPVLNEVGSDRWYVNTGDWVRHRSYATIRNGEAPVLHEWPGGSP